FTNRRANTTSDSHQSNQSHKIGLLPHATLVKCAKPCATLSRLPAQSRNRGGLLAHATLKKCPKPCPTVPRIPAQASDRVGSLPHATLKKDPKLCTTFRKCPAHAPTALEWHHASLSGTT